MTYNEMLNRLNGADAEVRYAVAAIEALQTEGVVLGTVDRNRSIFMVKPGSDMASAIMEHLNIIRDEAALRRNTLANLKDRVDDLINSAEVL